MFLTILALEKRYKCFKDIEMPIVKKFLLCLPLRLGLVAWGYFQFIASIFLSCYATVDFAEKSRHENGPTHNKMIFMYIFIMFLSLLEMIFCGFLTLGARKKNGNFLELCYHYQKAKVEVYAGVWVVCFFVSTFMFSPYLHEWFYNNMDPWRSYILFENISLGAIDWILQFYLLICVRSQLLKIEHVVELSTLYERLISNNHDSLWTNTMQKEPQKQPLPEEHKPLPEEKLPLPEEKQPMPEEKQPLPEEKQPLPEEKQPLPEEKQVPLSEVCVA